MQDDNGKVIPISEGLRRRQKENGHPPATDPLQSGTVDSQDRPEGLGGAGSAAYLDLLYDMRILHLAKNAGYGSSNDPWSNFRSAEQWNVEPWRGCLVRMSDKYQRLQNLLVNPANDQVGENVNDTAMDLAAYALIFICLYNEE